MKKVSFTVQKHLQLHTVADTREVNGANPHVTCTCYERSQKLRKTAVCADVYPKAKSRTNVERLVREKGISVCTLE